MFKRLEEAFSSVFREHSNVSFVELNATLHYIMQGYVTSLEVDGLVGSNRPRMQGNQSFSLLGLAWHTASHMCKVVLQISSAQIIWAAVVTSPVFLKQAACLLCLFAVATPTDVSLQPAVLSASVLTKWSVMIARPQEPVCLCLLRHNTGDTQCLSCFLPTDMSNLDHTHVLVSHF